ncbi:MAG: fibrobacter succinogenes major paralogous domain-containing protein [Fibromonadaceae bacterium]|jgi:uncharacterized protein (TIGR02145 family)|nr:fibrobacter succinogenes major paralogous domain-containing protein [Fibromonadaceae bacterium]
MKTTYFLSLAAIFALALTLFACDPQPETQGGEPSSSSGGTGSNGNCDPNDLGKGYDVIGSPYINWTDVKNIPVLDQNKMCQEGILDLGKSGGKQEYAWFSGSTIEELYSSRNESMKISTSLGATVKIPFVFSAGFETKFAVNTSNSSQQSSSKKYFYSQVRSYLYTDEDQIKSGSESARNLSKYLTADFISDLKSTKSPGAILDRYGSHVFIQYFKGGSLEANYTYLGYTTGSENSSLITSAKDMEVAAKLSFNKVDAAASAGASSSTSTSNEQRKNELENNMSFNYQTYGGKELKSTYIEKLVEEYGDWVSSIKNNARTTGIKDFAQSFIPIWDLAEQVEGVTSARIEALIEEFEKRAIAQGVKFPKGDNCTSYNNTDKEYCSNGTMKQYGSMTDKGGQTYKTVEIGTQTWMAQNLNYYVDGSRCYDNEDAICTIYGRLYNWQTAMDTTNKICPPKWHLPSLTEWGILMQYIDPSCSTSGNCSGDKAMAGKLLKATTKWDSTGNGTDDYGFAALPSGYSWGKGSNIGFDGIGKEATWWTSTQPRHSADSAYRRRIDYNGNGTFQDIYGISNDYYSVRCLKD